MGLLDRHVSSLRSEEFVLGCSLGFKGEAGSKFADIESTKIEIVSKPATKNWTGYKAVEQKVADESVGKAMAGKVFPARCLVTYERRSSTQSKTIDGKTVTSDIEVLVVTSMEYITPVDLVDVKVANQPEMKKAA